MGALFTWLLSKFFKGFSLGKLSRIFLLVSMMVTIHFFLTHAIEYLLDYYVYEQISTLGTMPEAVCFVMTRLDILDFVSFFLSAMTAVSFVRYFLNVLIPKFLD